MRLIDADALRKRVLRARWGGWIRGDVLEQILDSEPTVEPVVRCKDCKWYEIYQLKKDGTDDRRYKPSYCMLLRHNFKSDWYCADGERRDNEAG